MQQANNTQQQIVIMDAKQIAEFEALVLMVPGLYCNPILQKFATYKRLIQSKDLPAQPVNPDPNQEVKEPQKEENKTV